LSGTWTKENNRTSKRPEDPIKSSIVSNDRIKHTEVRVVGIDGEQLGIMPSKQALWQARNIGMDLIEITANANPPVVRIVDLNKWIYNLRREKKQKDKKARENTIIVKEIHLRPVTDKHDIEVKQAHAREFLNDNNKVKVLIKFRGRELSFRQKGFELLETFINGLGPCKIEKSPELNGRSILAIIAPNDKKV
jgi:translation initiation factor IF-3